jgi:hypothetical protein
MLDDQIRTAQWILEDWNNWGWLVLLLTSNLLIHARGKEQSALVTGIIAAQWILFQLARNLDVFWSGTVLSHSGPDEAVAVAIRYVEVYLTLTLGPLLPVAAFLWLPRFRPSLKTWRWALGGVALSAVNVAILFTGTSALLLRTK